MKAFYCITVKTIERQYSAAQENILSFALTLAFCTCVNDFLHTSPCSGNDVTGSSLNPLLKNNISTKMYRT